MGFSRVMIIARFDLRALALMEAGMLGISAAPWVILLRDLPDQQGVVPSHNPLTWLYAAVTPFLLAYALALAWQGLFRRGRAIWIEDGALHCPIALIRPRPLRDIVGVSKARYQGAYWLRLDSIIIELIGSKWIEIVTWCLFGPGDLILARLNQALADSRR